MFLHCFKYSFLDLIRTKVAIFWVICFPMILGTLFNFAFMNIYDSEDKFNTIPVAVVNGCDEGGVKSLIESMEKDGSEFVKASYVSKDEALTLLKNSEVDGIIYDDIAEPELTVRTGGGMSASIIKVFLDQYKTNAQIIMKTAEKNPEKLPELIENIGADTGECLKFKELSSGNMNPYTTYFYNLLAMSCMFVSMVGMYIPINTQANLSAVGARRSVSAVGKGLQNLAGILSATVIFYTGISVATAYLFFVLKIDFGISYFEVLAINFFGVLFGLSLGFFIGAIGKWDEKIKNAILLGVSLGTGFLSGLMVADMPVIIEEKCPIINRINPSRLIADSYYTVNSYGWVDRVTENFAKLIIISAVLITAGCLLTRKTKFKSL